MTQTAPAIQSGLYFPVFHIDHAADGAIGVAEVNGFFYPGPSSSSPPDRRTRASASALRKVNSEIENEDGTASLAW